MGLWLMDTSEGCLTIWESFPLTPTLSYFFLPSLVGHERDTGLGGTHRQPKATQPLQFIRFSWLLSRSATQGEQDLPCIVDSL